MKMPTQIVDEEITQGISIKERDLQGHLENANQKKDKTITPEEEAAILEKQAGKDQETETKNQNNKVNNTSDNKTDKNKEDKNKEDKTDLTGQDYQVREALNLLKGLSIIQSKLGS
jgi:hypothetical protein